ncbi:MAG TPA: hypothetical protein VHW00_13085 [Thermoanaerobaculia bacterium]|nr:hypothetical protein [Thermoanaerobaculia bacterium]
MSTQVAETILEQLGGRRFMVMTGARHFIAEGDALRFRPPSNLANKGIAVRITPNCMDTYDLIFSNVTGFDVTEIVTVTDIYADQLRDVFTHETGLDVVL